jgi:hypothetical protein
LRVAVAVAVAFVVAVGVAFVFAVAVAVVLAVGGDGARGSAIGQPVLPLSICHSA